MGLLFRLVHYIHPSAPVSYPIRAYASVLTSPVTVSSICLSVRPSSDWDFSLPKSVSEVSICCPCDYMGCRAVIPYRA